MAQESGLAPTLARLSSDWLTARHDSKGWPQFLTAITLDGIRGWSGQRVEMRFPVVAIAGENGAGKSTILKAAAAAYAIPKSGGELGARTFSPDDFFPNTPWETVAGVRIGYEYRLGENPKEGSLRKPSVRWRGMPERPQRVVYFLDISRTQPADTLIGYGRLARTVLAESEKFPLTEESRTILSKVMSRRYISGEVHRDETGKQIGVLQSGDMQYSNFHQGAGEDASMDLVTLLQEAPRNSLVLIDEIESSLHPRAQRRLMTELVELVRSKRMQLIVTTHSPYVLEQLPSEARVYVTADRTGKKEVIYGASAEYAIGMMDDVRHPELDVYCEDSEAAYIIEQLVRSEQPESVQRIRVVPAGPASTVRVLGQMVADDRFPNPSIAVLDGDQEPGPGCIKLPGVEAPEVTIFRGFSEAQWSIVAERLGLRPGNLFEAVDDALLDSRHHVWSKRIAEKSSPTLRSSRVWESAVDVWVRDVLEDSERRTFVDQVLEPLLTT